MSDRYVRPGWFTTTIFNPLVALLTRLGLSVYGSRIPAVRGRTPPRGLRPRQGCALRAGGQWRTTPVNLLTYRGERYLVAPRGVTQWVRNMALRAGRRREPIRVVELGDREKPDVLRAYLRRWQFEVGVFFQGVGPNASEDELRRIAPAHPVLRIVPPSAPGG